MPLNRLMHEPTQPSSIVTNGMRTVMAQMRKRMSILQTFADIRGESLINSVVFYTAADAAKAIETYTEKWFKNCPFSNQLRVRLANALINAAQSYPFLDVSAWIKVAESYK